jgi:two-component SAPR family response regulator
MYMREEYRFGFIFRMVTNRNENIDLVLTVNDTERYPTLVINEVAYIVPQKVEVGRWMPVSLRLSKSKNKIIITCAGKSLTVAHLFDRTSDVKIAFGTCPFKSFESTDIASVNIKDIKIFNDGKLKRYWKLKEHQQTLVLDSVADIAAQVINPDWLIDTYSTWHKFYSDKLPLNTQITFNPKGAFYIVSPDSKTIRVLNTNDGSQQTIPVNRGCIVSTSPNTIFYNSSTNQLVSYNLREAIFSKYSFDANEWSADTQSTTDPYLNNSATFNPADNTLYSFGGYEYYKYSHDLVRMNVWDGHQKHAELLNVAPRFSSSSVIAGKTLYLFGGRGSKTGKQEIAPRNYYDLYSFDLMTEQAIQLWEIDSITNDFLPSENMLFDAENNCFYVFTTLNGGCLIKIKPDAKGFETMSFPIGENIDALYLYTNLYYAVSQNKLYALIYQQKNQSEIDVSIYSLDYPPIPIRNLNQNSLPNTSSAFSWLKIFGIIGIIVLAGGTVYYIMKGRKKAKTPQNQPAISEKIDDEMPEIKYYDFSKSAICLLKNFTIIDKEGNDITGQFSPTLKKMLILLILNAEKDKKGIFGNKMLQLLWFDKNEESAKNIRNVYLSKLRSALEKVGDVEIQNKNGFWTIQLGNNIICDYVEAMRLFGSLKKSDSNYQEQIGRLLELLLLGVLLPNTEIDWLDNFKSDFSNLTIEVLTRFANEKERRLNDELRLRIADTLLLHDIANEEALTIKCSMLFRSGKKGLAKNVYDNFCKEYKNLFGTNYKYSLTEILAEK